MAVKFKYKVQATAANTVLSYLEKDPETNIPKLLDWWDKFDSDGFYANAREQIRNVMSDPENNWYKFIMSFWTDLDDGVRKTLFKNLIVQTFFIGNHIQAENREKYNCNIPWAILLDPTSACNLHCTGCWAAEYGHTMSMSYETLDNIITQAKELGTYMFIYTGGEPMIRKKDIIKLCEAHPECEFLSFTNGTLIDEEFADEMLRVKNFIPAFSIEGYEEATDGRRGNGTYQAVRRAMEILKERKLLFGVSCCYTKANAEDIGSESYIDSLIEWGAKFMWLFTYMPVGNDAVPDLLATAEQRKFMYRQIRGFRKTKPIFTMDFWNDGEYVNGCIAGGRFYLHINANGDIEPCAFIHYSDSNIYEKTLLEAYQSPLFMAYRENQPFNKNLLRPCPLLDNPGRLAKMVDDTGAHSTDMQSPEDVHTLTDKCRDAAINWKPVADELWDNEPHAHKDTTGKETDEDKIRPIAHVH